VEPRLHGAFADYLASWFTEPVLKKIAVVLAAIDGLSPPDLRPVFKVMLSDLCRDVSLQEPSDLRIRRRRKPLEDYPVVSKFVDSLRRKVGGIVRAQKHLRASASVQMAFVGDCRRECTPVMELLAGGGRRAFDAAITSPPYATALPYIDTQRLSLCLLGLIEARDIGPVEKSLIGTREIRDAERKSLEQRLGANDAGLPREAHDFCMMLRDLADRPAHGFRRRNVPALVYKYLSEMAEMFRQVRRMLRAGANYALVVGSNRTRLAGKVVAVETPTLLAVTAESCGWSVQEAIPLNTYPRYDVHQANSIHEETLLLLKAS
jgi:site-specific DNA-methyltransferase (cytosine-N4-specific)